MSKAGALDLATGLGGKIDKGEVFSAVEKYILHSLLFHAASCSWLFSGCSRIVLRTSAPPQNDLPSSVLALPGLFSPCTVPSQISALSVSGFFVFLDGDADTIALEFITLKPGTACFSSYSLFFSFSLELC